MVVALILFIITYILMMTFQTKRHIISVASALVFVVLGYFGLWELDIFSALGAVDYNVLLMIGGTMGTVS
ncbi:MAG: arsenic transporter, partial [Clostridia bacterium]|nr:arsenic transporter [Clostridia bacterium]